MKLDKRKIPGIKFDVIKWSEAQLCGRFILSLSDAEELCKRTKSGLPKNDELKEWFFDQVTSSLQQTLTNIKEGRSNVTPS
jgi:hypothetical protein